MRVFFPDMKTILLPFALIVLLVSAGLHSAAAQDSVAIKPNNNPQQPASTPDRLEALQPALRADRDARGWPGKKNQMARRRNEQYEKAVSSTLGAIREALANGDNTAAVRGLKELRGRAGTEDLRHGCDVLIDELEKQRQERNAALTEKVTGLLKPVSDAILSARQPKDLDASTQALDQFMKASDKGRASDEEQAKLIKRVQSAVGFLRAWQDYLAAKARGSGQEMLQILRRLASDDGAYGSAPLIPHSEILARMPKEAAPPAIVARNQSPQSDTTQANKAAQEVLNSIHTLDDLPVALSKLDQLRAGFAENVFFPSFGSDFLLIQSMLQDVQTNYAALRSGLATSINLKLTHADAGSQKPAIDAKIGALRTQLMVSALPRLLNAPGEKPAASEAADGFLRRLTEQARKREDWTSVIRGLDIAAASAPVADAATNSFDQELDAFQQFLAAKNLEAAGQYEQAAVGYLKTLKTGVQDLPTTLIGARLSAIQAAHPAEYAAANAYVLNPPPLNRGDPNDPFRSMSSMNSPDLSINPQTGLAFRVRRGGSVAGTVTMTMTLPANEPSAAGTPSSVPTPP